MIAYFDTSALVKLVIDEPGTPEVISIWHRASTVASNRLIYAEGRAALAQAVRQGRVTADEMRASIPRFERLYGRFVLVELDDVLVFRAGDLAEIHGLRGYDAVHLAAAERIRSSDRVLVSADFALLRAARAEGIKTSSIV
ncbi:MAG: type II toxin-antitoxin system VapC family toxin [Thermomicrobiales bacterium]|nr:type II toxin-antitoxin system VapC family toxin [Thermomicrobiales bacterium]